MMFDVHPGHRGLRSLALVPVVSVFSLSTRQLHLRRDASNPLFQVEIGKNVTVGVGLMTKLD